MYSYTEESIVAAIEQADESYNELQSLNVVETNCLGLVNTFISAVNDVPGLSVSISVEFDSSYSGYVLKLKEAANLIHNFALANGSATSNIRSKLNERHGGEDSISDTISESLFRGGHTPYDGEFFMQTDSRWSSESLGGSDYTIGGSGCFITSVLNQIVRSGTKTNIENPTPSDANSCFDINSDGSFSSTRDVTALAPHFIPVKEEEMTGMTKDEIAKMLNAMPDNYYVVFNVKAPTGNDHYVALNYVGDNGELYIMDSSYDFDELYSGYGRPLKYYVWEKKD